MEHPEELSGEELAAQDGQPVPDREAMSVLNADIAGIDNFAMPINEAVALNYESTQSVAYADADQTVIIGQLNQEPAPAVTAPPTEPGPIAEESPAPIAEEGSPAAETER